MNTLKETVCFECGKGSLAAKMTDLTGYRNDEEFSIFAHGLECTACGFKTIDSRHSDEFTKLVSDAYREKHGLLTGKQIREARRRLGMSQDQFAQYLKVGAASVHRWENGQIQDEAMNELLLLKTDPFAAMRNYQGVALVSGADTLVSYCDITGTIAPFVETQFRQPKHAYAPSLFQPISGYAPSC